MMRVYRQLPSRCFFITRRKRPCKTDAALSVVIPERDELIRILSERCRDVVLPQLLDARCIGVDGAERRPCGEE
jgi:hypothetical protein